MATQNIEIDGDLYSQLQAKAKVEGKTVDQLASEALRESLKEKRWQDMFAINKRPALSESEIVKAVHDYRAGR
jgi:predicted CopG family antitoxin